MIHPSKDRNFVWIRNSILFVTAVVALLMAPGSIFTQITQVLGDESETKSKSSAPATKYPQIKLTVPAIGATDVREDLKEISVTFDRKMGKGMSWTGGPPDFPPTDSAQKARWIDDFTCVLPVQLKKGTFYRVGFNSTSFQNFQSETGVPLPPNSLYFVTAGATQEVKDKVRTPKPIKSDVERSYNNSVH